MLQLYFIRHGETEWNRENRLQGQLNSPLTPKGKLQGRLLAERLSLEDFITAISSPSMRAVETARIVIGKREIPLYTDERLMEINLGSWQGKTKDEIKRSDPNGYDCYYHHPHLYCGDTGETFLAVKKRVEAVLSDLEERFSEGKLLIVTHGVVIKVLQQLICKSLPLEQLWDPPSIEGTSVTIINSSGGNRRLILEGDTSHMVRLRGE